MLIGQITHHAWPNDTHNELSCLTAVTFDGDILWDTARPDGTPRKLLDVSRLRRLGWRPAISLRKGIEATYRAYLQGVG